MQIGSGHKHRNIRLARKKNRWRERQKTSKDSKGVSLACNPVEIADPVVAHINSTNTGSAKDAFYFYGKRSGMLMA